jgi:hypothetical protein
METLDQKALKEIRIANNARLYDLGLLALSSREQQEVRQFRAVAELAVAQIIDALPPIPLGDSNGSLIAS